MSGTRATETRREAARLSPPHSIEAEEFFIGAALQPAFPEALAGLCELGAARFYSLPLQTIASNIISVHNRGLVVDLTSVGEAIDRAGDADKIGGLHQLARLVDQVATAVNLAHYKQTIEDDYQLRRIIGACNNASQQALGRQDGTRPGDITADLWENIRGIERAPQQGPVLVHLSDVKVEDVSWLWPGRLPIGKLSMVVGDPGLGKSYITVDCASRISRAKAWPDGSPAQLGHSVLLTAEDGIADTLRRRVDIQEGDPARIHVLVGVGNPEKPSSFNLAADLEHLEEAVLRTGACLVVIDPLSAYLGGVDSHKDADVRAILAPLSAMAERNHVAVLCVVHMNKSQQRTALYRAQGSLAFVAAARAVFGVAEDQDNPGQRLFVAMKNNLAPKPPALAFRIDNGHLEWSDGPIDVDANKVMAGEEEGGDRSALEEAKFFLRETLLNGPVSAIEVQKQSREAGISTATLRRAREVLGVTSGKSQFGGPWVWLLNGHATKGLNDAHLEHVDEYEHLRQDR